MEGAVSRLLTWGGSEVPAPSLAPGVNRDHLASSPWFTIQEGKGSASPGRHSVDGADNANDPTPATILLPNRPHLTRGDPHARDAAWNLHPVRYDLRGPGRREPRGTSPHAGARVHETEGGPAGDDCLLRREHHGRIGVPCSGHEVVPRSLPEGRGARGQRGDRRYRQRPGGFPLRRRRRGA